MKLINDFYFPDYDTQCSAAVFKELHKIGEILSLFPGRDAVIQAGGNVGTFPAELAKYFKHVYTFEPDEENFECLEMNTKHIPNIYRYKFGLGDKMSWGEMFQPDRADNCGSLAIKEGIGNVMIFNIDSLIISDSVDLIYLDIEGGEYKTLIGALNTIEEYKPAIVLENKGLIPGFEDGGFEGSTKLRKFVCSLGYKYVQRLMRDDIFLPS